MPHIHDQPGQHDATASAFIFLLAQDEPKVLLHIHKKIGKLLHFGGHIELSENPWQAIVREIKEESGYDISQLRLLQPEARVKKISSGVLIPYPIGVISVGYYGDNDKNHYHDDICFAFVTQQHPANDTHEGESADIRPYTQAEVAAMSDDEIVPALRELADFCFSECLSNWEQIPAQRIAR